MTHARFEPATCKLPLDHLHVTYLDSSVLGDCGTSSSKDTDRQRRSTSTAWFVCSAVNVGLCLALTCWSPSPCSTSTVCVLCWRRDVDVCGSMSSRLARGIDARSATRLATSVDLARRRGGTWSTSVVIRLPLLAADLAGC